MNALILKQKEGLVFLRSLSELPDDSLSKLPWGWFCLSNSIQSTRCFFFQKAPLLLQSSHFPYGGAMLKIEPTIFNATRYYMEFPHWIGTVPRMNSVYASWFIFTASQPSKTCIVYLTDRIRQLLPAPVLLRSCKQCHLEQTISWKVAKRYSISFLGKEVLCHAQDDAFWRHGNQWNKILWSHKPLQ